MMMFFKLLSAMSALCLVLSGRHGNKRCQRKCWQLWGCNSVKFNPNHLRILCMRTMDSTDEVSIPEPSLHQNPHGTRICCRACQKREVCAKKLKKTCVSVRKHGKKVEDMCATGRFKPVPIKGSEFGGPRTVVLRPASLRIGNAIFASFNITRADFFFWVVDINLMSHSYSKKYVFSSYIAKDNRLVDASMRLSIRDSLPCFYGRLKNGLSIRLHSWKFRLVFLYKNKDRQLMALPVEEGVFHEMIAVSATDVIPVQKGHFIIKQEFILFRFGDRRTKLVFKLPECEDIRFHPKVKARIDRFFHQ